MVPLFRGLLICPYLVGAHLTREAYLMPPPSSPLGLVFLPGLPGPRTGRQRGLEGGVFREELPSLRSQPHWVSRLQFPPEKGDTDHSGAHRVEDPTDVCMSVGWPAGPGY